MSPQSSAPFRTFQEVRFDESEAVSHDHLEAIHNSNNNGDVTSRLDDEFDDRRRGAYFVEDRQEEEAAEDADVYTDIDRYRNSLNWWSEYHYDDTTAAGEEEVSIRR